MKSPKTKKVLITGAGTGIGLSCVEKFMEEGWYVYAHYNQTSQKLLKLKNKSKTSALTLLQSDFSNQKTVPMFINLVKSLSLNALVNNAGIHDSSSEAKDRIESVQNIMLINTIVPALLAETVLEILKKKQGGSIVNVSSIGVKYGSNLKTIFYSVSKSGLEGITKTLAREGATHKVLVNCIRPGVTDTEFHVKLGRNMEQRKQLIPLKRMAQPAEIARFIYFLCAENTYITGETIPIAGGE